MTKISRTPDGPIVATCRCYVVYVRRHTPLVPPRGCIWPGNNSWFCSKIETRVCCQVQIRLTIHNDMFVERLERKIWRRIYTVSLRTHLISAKSTNYRNPLHTEITNIQIDHINIACCKNGLNTRLHLYTATCSIVVLYIV